MTAELGIAHLAAAAAELSVVVPILEERPGIAAAYTQLRQGLAPLGRRCEVIYVVDGPWRATLEALKAGEIDVYVDYSGTIWVNQMQRADVKPRAEVLQEVSTWLRETHGLVLLGGLGFENAYALAMPRTRADQLGVRSIADLAGSVTIKRAHVAEALAFRHRMPGRAAA